MRRTPQHQALSAPPQGIDQRRAQGRHHGHVQPRNADQMRHPCTAKDLPLLAGNGALIANREGHKYTDVRSLRQLVQKALSNHLAQALDGIARTPHESFLSNRFFAGAYRPGGTNAALDQPRLVIKAMRVGGTVRAFQTYRETPTLAGMHGAVAPSLHRTFRPLVHRHFTFAVTAKFCTRRNCFAFRVGPVPREDEARRHARAGRFD